MNSLPNIPPPQRRRRASRQPKPAIATLMGQILAVRPNLQFPDSLTVHHVTRTGNVSYSRSLAYGAPDQSFLLADCRAHENPRLAQRAAQRPRTPCAAVIGTLLEAPHAASPPHGYDWQRCTYDPGDGFRDAAGQPFTTSRFAYLHHRTLWAVQPRP